MSASVADPVCDAILRTLAQEPHGDGMSLPRLGKRLGLGASVLMRNLTLMGDAALGGVPGPGWVRVVQTDDRWVAHLTEEGLLQCASPPALVRLPVQRFNGEDTGVAQRWSDDTIAAEVPVALVFNGISHAVMMATPRDLHEFALGFALSEGLIDTRTDCHGVEVRVPDSASPNESMPIACEVHLEITSRCFARLKERRRSLGGRTGCGICGIDSLQALDLVPEPVVLLDWVQHLDAATILRAVAAMPALQTLNAQAGAIHAAAWATPQGELTDLFEDVGRHNALDKLLGRLALQGRLTEPGFVVMSSRASYELVRKCARLDIPVLATISAPTHLAINIASQAGMQLWGICRPPSAVRYVAAQGQAVS